jgi:hypothetical protein
MARLDFSLDGTEFPVRNRVDFVQAYAWVAAQLAGPDLLPVPHLMPSHRSLTLYFSEFSGDTFEQAEAWCALIGMPPKSLIQSETHPNQWRTRVGNEFWVEVSYSFAPSPDTSPRSDDDA